MKVWLIIFRSLESKYIFIDIKIIQPYFYFFTLVEKESA
jgi:hypothetical protein